MSVETLAAAMAALKSQLHDAIEHEAERLVAEGPGPYTFTIATTNGALRRGAFAFEQDWGGHVDDANGNAGICFSLIHALGETAALRRVKIALTDPRSRGREVAVIEALTDGLEVEEAIQRANRPPPDPPAPDGGNVVPFRR